MTVCLQGGGEFSPGCRPMDEQLLTHVDGPVVVTALAGAPGREYRTATDNGVRHFRACGAGEVMGAPDVREDSDGALRVLRTARLLVLPGGSPARLLTALRTSPVGQHVLDLVADGGAVMGASAGAMVLGAWTVLPETRGPDGELGLEEGLGLVPGVAVVPHWRTGASRLDWLRALAGAPAPLTVLGLPEESGVLVQGGAQAGIAAALGQHATRVVSEDRDVPVGEELSL
ncbi:MAG: cyanophycinase [Frankiales bacterium]|jgi:cyanophycinase-like exopeptidase|nr:cyanophycinase [Frankiales bacterium]